MAVSKQKRVIQKETPRGRYVGQVANPDSYYQDHPAWNFNSCDSEMWEFTKDSFWEEVLPFLKNLETQTWSDILVGAKKQHHSIEARLLNALARKRLADRRIEQDAIISLHLTGTHRIYGYIVGKVFNILWYDSNHGDNDTCVCRSHKKHT